MKLDKAYEPAKYESNIYSEWEQSGVFSADPTSGKPHFSISMPPPNETGTLHVGHALFLTLQDIMARHARQTGHDVLWLPGTDHAALPVNALIEKQLAEQGTNKHEVGREKFLKITREFVGSSRDTINSQIRAMGSSCDWGRARYTLDDALNRTVIEVFSKMYHDGLIYRGHRIVNWDPNLETTVSDDEVVRKEEKAPFYTLQYGPFQISTARPETKFGDKYVVMHPDDDRYSQYKSGDTFEAKWLNGTVTATVIKDEAVNRDFGTGVMTITPWHDHTDFEIAERHGLEKEQIIGFDGKLLPIAGEFAGLPITEARPKIVEKLDKLGLLVSVDENYVHSLAINDRGKGVIEPQIKLQWFVDVNRPAMEWKGQMRSLREVMRAVVEDGDIDIIPKRFEKVYYHWIDNLRDWCVSRQIWWGHQIPAWHRAGDTPEIYVGLNAPEGDGWSQDPDTLDTWFSSALWTWSTLIDPELAKDQSLTLEQLLDGSPDFKAYHPTSVMETGWDILFFWVARMILATTYATSQIPFKKVYLHGLVRTEMGKKMSKSDPDSILDPMEVIKEFGTDALRLALVSGVTAGNDQRLGQSKIITNRNFCNKLWNVSRYIEGVVGENNPSTTLGTGTDELSPNQPADHWILNKLSIFADSIKKNLATFNFSECYDTLYHFIWDYLADWYIEASKTEPNREVLAYVLESTLIITHPFAPFVTEAIWQSLGWNDTLLAAQPWLNKVEFDLNKSAEFEHLKAVVTEVRWIKAIAEAKPENLYYEADMIDTSQQLVGKLAGIAQVSKKPDDFSGGLKLTTVNGWAINIDPASVKDKLEAKRQEYQAIINNISKRLDNADYRSKAPAELIKESEQQMTEAKTTLSQITSMLS